MYILYSYQASALFPSELRISQQWAALDPQICPDNSDLIAYVSGGDIWVTHTLSGHGERLTYAHDGRRTLSEDPLMAGVPSYVMQEEFSRYQGYWWQPKSQSQSLIIIITIWFFIIKFVVALHFSHRWRLSYRLRRGGRKRRLPVHLSVITVCWWRIRRVPFSAGRHPKCQIQIEIGPVRSVGIVASNRSVR